ncbi:MAG: LysM peptidoglycan-binding domain-containing protein, partial [Pedosphaera parvula]|nr:LysM peptidoglycan-binding domain-containing protein [Pedosphaera parvula]
QQLVESLKAQVAHHTPVPPTSVGPAPAPAAPLTNAVAATPAPRLVEPALATTSTPGTRSAPAGSRNHTVKTGETPSSIARHYGLSVNVLLEANPKVNPRRMQVGQTLRIPAP